MGKNSSTEENPRENPHDPAVRSSGQLEVSLPLFYPRPQSTVPVKIKKSDILPSVGSEIFPRPSPLFPPKTSADNNFADDVRNPSITPQNPSILLSHQRANCPGPGTPMPLLSPSAYPYPYWQHTFTLNPLSSFPHPEKFQKPQRNEEDETPKRSRTLVEMPTQDEKLNLIKSVKHQDRYDCEASSPRRRCASDWINEKSTEESTRGKTPSLLDRGTSSIKTNRNRARMSKDVALASIRCIEPLRRGRSRMSEKPNQDYLGNGSE
uniref:SPICE1 protein n=1 Tax=Fopius arisanus TaxID=64838 RepID=A0A0C9RND1_9HYME